MMTHAHASVYQNPCEFLCARSFVGGGCGLSAVLLLSCRSQTYSGPLSLLSYGTEMWADTTEFYKAQLAGFVMQAYYSFVPVGALQE